MNTVILEQTEAQVRIDRYFLHHPEHEQHPVAVFFRELMGEWDADTAELQEEVNELELKVETMFTQKEVNEQCEDAVSVFRNKVKKMLDEVK